MASPNDYLRVCEEAVRAGGRVVQDWAGRVEVRKKGPADLVTQADLASQETVRRMVLGAFPGHCLLGEEAGELQSPGTGPFFGEKPHFQGERSSENMDLSPSRQDFAGLLREESRPGEGTVPIFGSAKMGLSPSSEKLADRTEYRWIVDPLDGTTNYVHDLPHYCVSLALEQSGRLLVGAVYDPVLDECFTAADGRGAWLNGRPLHTSQVTQLSESLAAVGFPPNVQRDAPDLRLFLELLPRCQAIRRTGSAALNLCYLAAGRFDLFWSYSTHIWDVAAGVLILREAGGCLTSPDGGPFSLEEAHFLAAANGNLHAQLHEIAGKLAPAQKRTPR